MPLGSRASLGTTWPGMPENGLTDDVIADLAKVDAEFASRAADSFHVEALRARGGANVVGAERAAGKEPGEQAAGAVAGGFGVRARTEQLGGRGIDGAEPIEARRGRGG